MIVEKYGMYDGNRFSTPYLAKIVLEGEKLRYLFDSDAFKGTFDKGGVLESDVNDGDFILYGQQDYTGVSSKTCIGEILDGRVVELSPKTVLARLKRRQRNNG